MSETEMDLLGMDETGDIKLMKAGSKNPYKFKGKTVREIPLSNPYQMGGFTYSDLFNFLFEGDDEKSTSQQVPTAPSTEEVDEDLYRSQRKKLDDEYSYYESLLTATSNPYRVQSRPNNQSSYTGEILSSGQYGNQNVGDYGKEIYGNLATDLGYAPVANSIFRSKQQQEALIASGAPAAKNSWHLSGNAIDLKPADWNKLSKSQQQFYKTNYSVVYHNNHYHIEPK